jgi:hypothetical protein
MTAVRITYDRLDTSELHGTTQADYLISVDATLSVWQGHRCLHEESSFPVLELARALYLWLDESDREDFVFNSMSYEDEGVFAVRQAGSGWTFSSVFAADSATRPVCWDAAEASIRSFVAQAEGDLRGLGVDPVAMLHQ